MGRVSEVATALRRSRFISFDGAVSMSSLHQRPDRYRHLEADLGGEKRIARGAGLSYSAASFGEGIIVQEMSSFNRVLALDRDQCTVRVEAGLTVGDLLDLGRTQWSLFSSTAGLSPDHRWRLHRCGRSWQESAARRDVQRLGPVHDGLSSGAWTSIDRQSE